MGLSPVSDLTVNTPDSAIVAKEPEEKRSRIGELLPVLSAPAVSLFEDFASVAPTELYGMTTPPRIIKHGDAVSVNSNETSPGMDVLQAKVDLAEAKLALAQAKEEASSHSSSRSFGSSKTAADRRPELPLQTSVLRASSISPPPMKVVKCPPSPKPDSIDEQR